MYFSMAFSCCDIRVCASILKAKIVKQSNLINKKINRHCKLYNVLPASPTLAWKWVLIKAPSVRIVYFPFPEPKREQRGVLSWKEKWWKLFWLESNLPFLLVFTTPAVLVWGAEILTHWEERYRDTWHESKRLCDVWRARGVPDSSFHGRQTSDSNQLLIFC